MDEHPQLVEIVDTDHGPVCREWFCPVPPGGREFIVLEAVWLDEIGALLGDSDAPVPVEQIYRIQLTPLPPTRPRRPITDRRNRCGSRRVR